MNTRTDLAGRLREEADAALAAGYPGSAALLREAAEALSTSSDARVGVKARRLLDLLRTDGDPAALIIPDFKDDEHQQAYIEAYDDLTRALAPASSGEREPDYHERHQIMEMAEAASPEKDEPAGDTRLVEAACEVWRRIRHWDAGDRGEPVGIIQDVLRDFGLSTSPPSLAEAEKDEPVALHMKNPIWVLNYLHVDDTGTWPAVHTYAFTTEREALAHQRARIERSQYHVHKTWLQAPPSLADAVAALTRAGEQFRFYQKEHLAKGTAEGNAKAMTNEVFAEICEDALAKIEGGRS